jgi:branched-subunit amino acid aminotransferase/4-amino-4-deoxychorismate lyase
MTAPLNFSQTWTFFEGNWHEGNVPIMGPRTHAAWLGSVVFDGARAFEGVAPDLDRHCARVNQSAINFKLKPVVDSETWLGLAREDAARTRVRRLTCRASRPASQSGSPDPRCSCGGYLPAMTAPALAMWWRISVRRRRLKNSSAQFVQAPSCE